MKVLLLLSVGVVVAGCAHHQPLSEDDANPDHMDAPGIFTGDEGEFSFLRS